MIILHISKLLSFPITTITFPHFSCKKQKMIKRKRERVKKKKMTRRCVRSLYHFIHHTRHGWIYCFKSATVQPCKKKKKIRVVGEVSEFYNKISLYGICFFLFPLAFDSRQ